MNKNILNTLLLFVTLLLPLYLMNLYQNSVNIESIQIFLHIVMFLGSILLMYLNNKYRKQLKRNIWYTIFQIIGFFGLLFSGFVLFLLYSFRNGIGF